MKKIFIYIAILAGFVTKANAQAVTASATQTTNLALSDAIELTFANGGGGTQSMAFNTIFDLLNGVQSTTQDLVVKSNKKFKVSVATNSNNFTYTGSATSNNVIPVSSALKIMVVSNNTGGSLPLTFLLSWLGLSGTSSQTLLTNCNAGGNQTFTVKYKTTPGSTSAAGTYTAEVVYTATQM